MMKKKKSYKKQEGFRLETKDPSNKKQNENNTKHINKLFLIIKLYNKRVILQESLASWDGIVINKC